MKAVRGSLLVLGGVIFALLLMPTVGAAQGTLYIENNRVGIGTATPQTSLEVKGSDDASLNRIRVQNSSGTKANRMLLELVNDRGGAQFYLSSGSEHTTWQFSNTRVGFIASLVGTGGAEFTIAPDGRVKMGPGESTVFDLDPTGNLTIEGVLTENSSRGVKHNLSPVDVRDVLDRVNELPILAWTYKFDDPLVRHVGPMAEDFHSAFGLGADAHKISTLDTSGVALAAIQGLSQMLEGKEAEIEELKRANSELAARIDALEKALSQLVHE